MARMVPFPMQPTESSAERRLYEAFLEQLDDDYVVYHSVDWVLGPRRRGGPPQQGEADFVLAHPVDGLLVVEAKGGEVGYDPDLRRWFQAGRGGRHDLDDPFHQAREEMDALVRILSQQPGWKRWKPSYGYGVAFPDGSYDHDAYPEAPAACAIDRHDMRRLAERVPEIMERWRRPERRFGADGMGGLERALGFTVELRTPWRVGFDEDDRRIVELTDEQSYVLSYVSHLRRATIAGPAGTGKTTLAIQLARRLAQGGSRTLLTCFNWRLAGELREAVAGQDRLETVDFHELCRRVAGDAHLEVPPAPSDEAAARTYEEETLPALLARAAEQMGPRYDAMVVDEAQDFRATWWPSLLALHADPEAGPLFLLTDTDQGLREADLPEGMGGLTLRLPANLRSTRAIHQFVSVFSAASAKVEVRGPAGRPVEILDYRDGDELVRLLEVVLANLEGAGASLEDVVVLTPNRASESPLRRRGGVGRFRFSDRPAAGTVLVCTIHGFRGLERRVVILAELDHGDRRELAKYLYLGGSRARDHLIVLAAEPIARELRDLAGIETATKTPALRAAGPGQ
jgi:hypothetical protein